MISIKQSGFVLKGDTSNGYLQVPLEDGSVATVRYYKLTEDGRGGRQTKGIDGLKRNLKDGEVVQRNGEAFAYRRGDMLVVIEPGARVQ